MGEVDVSRNFLEQNLWRTESVLSESSVSLEPDVPSKTFHCIPEKIPGRGVMCVNFWQASVKSPSFVSIQISVDMKMFDIFQNE